MECERNTMDQNVEKPKVEKSVHELKNYNRIKIKTEKYSAKCLPFFVFSI